jgi:putative glutamine amidotransferase
MREHRWLIGVQWHPELTAERDAVQQRLFDSLIEAAGEFGTAQEKSHAKAPSSQR